MSVNVVSVVKLYEAVANNDIESLERAILRLGVKIHEFRICGTLNPMVYAGRLGHMELVQVLLSDLVENGTKSIISTICIELLKEILPHRELQKELVDEIVLKIADRVENFSRFQAIILDFKQLDLLTPLLRTREKDIGLLVYYCVRSRKKELYHLPSFVQKTEYYRQLVLDKGYDEEFQREFNNDLVLAMIRNDTITLKSILAEKAEDRMKDPCMIHNVMVDNVEMLEFLLDDSNLKNVLKTTDKSLHKLCVDILEYAISIQSSELITTLLAHKKFNRKKVDWMGMYFELLFCNVSEAACIKPFVDFTNQKERDKIFKEISQKVIDVKVNIPADDFIQIVEEVEALPNTKTTDSDSVFRDSVKMIPVRFCRPDLIEPLKKLGLNVPNSVEECLNCEDNLDVLRSTDL